MFAIVKEVYGEDVAKGGECVDRVREACGWGCGSVCGGVAWTSRLRI